MKREDFIMVHIIKFSIISLILLITTSCKNEFAIRHYMHPKVLNLNKEYIHPGSSNIKIKVSTIEISNNKCFIEIKDINNGQTCSGWTEEGHFIDFASGFVGTKGIFIKDISRNNVSVEFRWATASP